MLPTPITAILISKLSRKLVTSKFFQPDDDSNYNQRPMSFSDIPNLWVPLMLLSLIIIAAIFFSRN